ncbi:MAG: hypothetical protein HY515_02075, partial [Candidatus Aenigmarchaeota archaeon]|nr:hypothetical protein [Candidatus Aenigmarchaeota archaeon]
MTLARLLGQYQRPVFLMDTSALVGIGQHNFGVLSPFTRHIIDMEAEDKNNPYHVVVLERAAREYARLLEQGVCDDYGIPKSSVDLANDMGYTEFSDDLRSRIREARELWQKTSAKAPTKSVPGQYQILPSMTDQEIIAFVIEQADNHRRCYVFSDDEDIKGPVKSLSMRNPWIHYVERSFEKPSLIAGSEKKPLLITRRMLGEIYGAPTSAYANYLLTAKMPLLDEEVEVAVSVCPVENGRIIGNETGMARHALYIRDIDELLDVKGWQRRMLEDRRDGELKRNAKKLMSKNFGVSFMNVIRSRKLGQFRVGHVVQD